MLNKKNILIISFVLILISCKHSPVSSDQQFDLIPLKVGQSWKYTVTTFDSLGYVEGSGLIAELIDQDTVINNRKWFYSFNSTEWYSPNIVLYSNQPDGLYRSTDSGKTSTNYFKYPAAINDISVSNGDSTIVIKVNELVTVKSGTYLCLLYQKVYNRNSSRIVLYTYVSPGYGKIKGDWYSYTNGMSYHIGTYELIEFSNK